MTVYLKRKLAVLFIASLFLLVNVSRNIGWSNSVKTDTKIDTPAENPDAYLRFAARRSRLKAACEKQTDFQPRSQWKIRLNFLLDVPSHLLVCAVPKSGSSAWISFIWAINRNRKGLSFDRKLYTNNDTKAVQRIASAASVEEGNNLIKRIDGDDNFSRPPPQGSSFRIILARHPFARLISGWNQKFSVKSNYWVFLAQHNMRLLKYRKTLTENHVMAFPDFARFLVEVHGSGRYFDSHFHPATQLCRICEYDYTYIVKAESLDIDEKWLRKRMKLSDIPLLQVGVGPSGGIDHENIVESIKKHFSMLDLKLMRKLYDLYRHDFEYFGYTFNFTTLVAGGFT